MKRLTLLFVATLLAVLTGCKDTVIDNYKLFSNWEINNANSLNGISWTKFEWVNGNLGGKIYQKYAINVPCKIDGVQNPLTFQLDLGAYLTGVYENTFGSFYNNIPDLKSKIKSNSSGRYYENMTINFGDYSATNKSAYVYPNYGGSQSINPTDTIHLGTIGADIFQDKILIIDYPKRQFAICDKVPPDYIVTYADITLDKGRVILPMTLANNSLNILFDTGSSLFPIITDGNKIGLFSTGPNIDTIQVSSWGKVHNVIGKAIKDNLFLAGEKFSSVKAYVSTVDIGLDKDKDGITGNALFWDRVIVVDFRNKKFGVK